MFLKNIKQLSINFLNGGYYYDASKKNISIMVTGCF